MTTIPNTNSNFLTAKRTANLLTMAGLLSIPAVQTVSGATWDTPSSVNWKNNNNWDGNWPGRSSSVSEANDTATFDTGYTGTRLKPRIYNVGSNTNHVFLENLNFTNPSGIGTASYDIESRDGKLLVIKTGGRVTVDSAVTSNQDLSITLRPQQGTTTYTNNGTGILRIDSMQAYWSPGTFNASLQFNGSGDISVGRLQDRTASQTLQVTKNGNGTLTLNGNSNYTRETRLRGDGHIRIETNTALGSTAGRTRIDGNNGNGGSVQLANGITVAERFTLYGRQSADANSPHLNNVAGNNTLTGAINTSTGGSRFNLQSDTGLLTIQGNISETTSGNDDLRLMGAGNAVVTGNITNNAVGSQGLLRIFKTGTGTWSLNGTTDTRNPGGTNGSVTVQGGTLSVGGTMHGNVTVQSGGTLSGGGTVDGTVSVGSGSVISPGESPGTIATGGQTWNDGGSYLWEVNSTTGAKGADPGWDWIDITGGLDLTNLTPGGFEIDITSLTSGNIAGDAVGFDIFNPSDLNADYSFIIASASTGITGFDAANFVLDSSAFTNGGTSGFPDWQWQISQDGNDLVLGAIAIPEPSSTALLGLGGLALILRRKRA